MIAGEERMEDSTSGGAKEDIVSFKKER